MQDDQIFTYDELALALNRSLEATRQLVKRKHWHRTMGNDGKARISVPTESVTVLRRPNAVEVAGPPSGVQPQDMFPEHPPAAPIVELASPSSDARALIALLELRAAELQARVTILETELGAANKSIAQLRSRAGQADVLEAQLEAERRRADDLKQERDRLLDRALNSTGSFIERIKRAFNG